MKGKFSFGLSHRQTRRNSCVPWLAGGDPLRWGHHFAPLVTPGIFVSYREPLAQKIYIYFEGRTNMGHKLATSTMPLITRKRKPPKCGINSKSKSQGCWHPELLMLHKNSNRKTGIPWYYSNNFIAIQNTAGCQSPPKNCPLTLWGSIRGQWWPWKLFYEIKNLKPPWW